MLYYLLGRIRYSILVLWGVATLVFLLFYVLPGNYVDATSGEAIRKALHSENPILTRYGLYLNDLSPLGITSAKKTAEAPSGVRLTRIDDSSYLSIKAPHLGRSLHMKRSVSAVMREAFPGTIILVSTALLLATIIGIGLGMLSALKKHTFWDMGAVAASIAGISVPVFFVGLIVAYVSGYLLSGYTGIDTTGSLKLAIPIRSTLPMNNFMLPAMALSIRPMAAITQYTRSAMLDVLSQDYIRNAYTKGIGKTHIVLRHAMPNALSRVVTETSGWLAELLAGSFFVEYIFGWEGIGTITVNALERLDLPIVIGATLLIALMFIVIKLLTDLLRRMLDPQARRL